MLLLIFGIKTFHLHAQKEVSLSVSHYLGNDSFVLERPFKNNLGFDIQMSRFDYFISNISLYHDGGKEIKIPDIYILSRDGKNFRKQLGSFPVSSLDSIAFYVGVDSVNNHADPALWPAGHALAPVFPDMHWGWAAGYRFAAIEGNNGPDLFYQYQLHPIGDELFYRTVVPAQGKSQKDTLFIELKADCAKSLDNLNFSKVVFDHGAGKDAVTVMKNFASNVFSSVEETSSSINHVPEKLVAAPNPSEATFLIRPAASLQNADVIYIYDQLGRLIKRQQVDNWPVEIHLDGMGTFFAHFLANGKVLGNIQLVKL
jgi:hypothetical protein